MENDHRCLVFGPAYLDVVVEVDRPLLAQSVGDPEPRVLDQSLPAADVTARDDDRLCIMGPTGDRLMIEPAPARVPAVTCTLCEPVLARLLGGETRQTVAQTFGAVRCDRQLGGMGAGYAKALGGVLRMPLGGAPDAVGCEVLAALAHHQIPAVPSLLAECASDTSLLLLSPYGDKLAIGVRQAMTRWRLTAEDHALVADAGALVFCGAPNALLAEVLHWRTDVPVMCAPAMRNVSDTAVPLADLAAGIHYLTLNALEWAHLDGRERLAKAVPVISITDGPRDSLVLCGGEHLMIPAVPHVGPTDTNRAGETFGATFFNVLRAELPAFPRAGVAPALAARAGRRAALQAERQLALTAFGFPSDDWQVDDA